MNPVPDDVRMMPVPQITTLNDLFFRVASAANPRAVLWQDHAGQWQPLLSDQIYQRVRAVGSRLLEWGVKKGDRVALNPFGSFVVRARQAREGRNPKTGEKITIAARKVPVFVAGTSLKDAVGGSRPRAKREKKS